MYHCKVINYGYGRRTFPTRIGNLYIDWLRPFEIREGKIDDPQGVVADLRVFEQSDKLVFEVVVDDENGQSAQQPGAVDYAGHSINELRSIAAGKGVKGVFYMKKPDLIQILQEV